MRISILLKFPNKKNARILTNGNQQIKRSRAVLEQTFKNLDDVLWKEAGCSSELDSLSKHHGCCSSNTLMIWQERAMEADLTGKSHDFIIQPEFRWSTWAALKNDDGTFDRDNGLKGDDLTDFAKNELFPYLEGSNNGHHHRTRSNTRSVKYSTRSIVNSKAATASGTHSNS